jgi:hypothetical protein
MRSPLDKRSKVFVRPEVLSLRRRCAWLAAMLLPTVIATTVRPCSRGHLKTWYGRAASSRKIIAEYNIDKNNQKLKSL